MTDKFMRQPLVCPKCQSSWMDERQVREMFLAPYKGSQPLYSGATKTRIYCGDCGALVWKEGMVLSKAGEAKIMEGLDDLEKGDVKAFKDPDALIAELNTA